MQRDLNPDRLDDGARAEAEMNARLEALERERDAMASKSYMVCLSCYRHVNERSWRAIGLPTGAVRCPCGSQGNWARGHSFWKAKCDAAEAKLASAMEALDIDEAVYAAALTWCGEKERETFIEDIEYFKHNWRSLPGLTSYVVRVFERRARTTLSSIKGAAE
jgi:hypothetical protein